ncbi:MAG: hypothetical protein ACOY94_22070 [Bacillota bacterium]
MHPPEPIRRVYAPFVSLPMETLTKAWWREACAGQPRQRSVAEMAEHHRRYGAGGNCFDLAYWLLVQAREAGIAARAVGHDFETWEAHAAIILTGHDGHEYLADPGDKWLQPLLISPAAPAFDPGCHAGFFPGAAVAVEREGTHLTIRYRRPNGKESTQEYDLTPVSDETFLRACHHSAGLLRRPIVEALLPHPETGEIAHWDFDRGRSVWSTDQGLLVEEDAGSTEGWVARIAGRTGIAPEIIRTALAVYSSLEPR